MAVGRMGLDPTQIDALLNNIHFALTFDSSECRKMVTVPLANHQIGSGFMACVAAHRVASVVDSATAAGALPGPIAAAVHELAINEALLALTLASETVRAYQCLTDANISTLAFKGVALSVQSTDSVTARGNGDIDLLVRPAQVLDAVRVLGKCGWELAEISTESLQRRWRAIRWSGRELVLLGPRSQIDLHWQVAKEPKLLPTTQMLLDRSSSVEILGTDVLTFDQADALLAACYHLSHDGFRSLRQCVDVIRLLRLQEQPVRWTKQQQRMADEAASFAIGLIGGVCPEQLKAIGITPQETPRADKRWTQLCLHPEHGYRRPGTAGVLDRIVDNRRDGSSALALARRGVLRVAMR